MQSSKTTIALSNPHPAFGSTEVFKTFNYAPAVAAGGLLFIAGQIGIRADGTVPSTIEEQIDLAFQRLGAILQAAGLGFEDLVELVNYHVDVDKQLTVFLGIKDRYINADAPAWDQARRGRNGQADAIRRNQGCSCDTRRVVGRPRSAADSIGRSHLIAPTADSRS